MKGFSLYTVLCLATAATSVVAQPPPPTSPQPTPQTPALMATPSPATMPAPKKLVPTLDRESSALVALDESVARLRTLLNADDIEAREAVNGLQQVSAALLVEQQQQVSRGVDFFASRYVDSLRSLTQLLTEASAPPFDAPRAIAALRDVKEDLNSKIQHLRRDPPVEEAGMAACNRGPCPQPIYTVAGAITVMVRTKRGNTQVGGWEVWYVQRGWANSQTKWRRFDSISDVQTPARQVITPGNYLMWTKQGERSGTRLLVPIGGGGRSEQTLDLLIP